MKRKRATLLFAACMMTVLFAACATDIPENWTPVRAVTGAVSSEQLADSFPLETSMIVTTEQQEVPATTELPVPETLLTEPVTETEVPTVKTSAAAAETAEITDVPDRASPTQSDPLAETETGEVSEVTYIANKNTKKFHIPTCSSVTDMKESNKLYCYGSRDELIDQGYEPCKRCKP